MSEFLDFINRRITIDFYKESPPVHILEKGTTLFLVDSDRFQNIYDITRDGLSPWTGKYRNSEGEIVKASTKIRNVCVLFEDDMFKKCDFVHSKNKCCKDNLILKVFTNYHPKYAARRNVAVILEGTNNNQRMVSPVFYEFSLEDRIERIPTKARILPSVSEQLAELLDRRTTAQAKALASSMKLNVSNSQVISRAKNVENLMKSGKGRRTPSDVRKLLDLYATNVSENLDILPCEIYKNEDKICFTQIVGFVVAIQHFCATLPTTEDFETHLSEINELTSLPKAEANKEFEKILKSVTPSGTILNIGALIQIDTTFSLSSGEYVTYALANSDMFQTKSSGKNASVILGLMIHSSKQMKHHDSFARYLTKQLEKYGEKKSLPGIISDGEQGFFPYTTGSIFSKAIKLRCNLHVIDNIKRLFSVYEKDEAQTLIQMLFGKIEKRSDGTLFRKGALVSFSYDSFSVKFDRLVNDYPEKIKKWLFENKQGLFDHNSLISKIRAGQTQQFLTTNLIENRNNEIKQLIPKPTPAHKVINIFAMLSENEIKERLSAILSQSENLTTHFKINFLDWTKMTNKQKMKSLVPYGLQNCFYESKFLKYPTWLIEGDGKHGTDKLIELIESTQIHPSKTDENLFFAVSENEKLAMILFKNGFLICHDDSCKKQKNYGFFLCSHCLAAFLVQPEEIRAAIVDNLDEKRKTKTIKQVQAAQLRPEDGSKFSQKRKGTQKSKSNHVREYDMLSSTLETSDYMFVSSDSDVDMPIKKSKLIDSDDDY